MTNEESKKLTLEDRYKLILEDYTRLQDEHKQLERSFKQLKDQYESVCFSLEKGEIQNYEEKEEDLKVHIKTKIIIALSTLLFSVLLLVGSCILIDATDYRVTGTIFCLIASYLLIGSCLAVCTIAKQAKKDLKEFKED